MVTPRPQVRGDALRSLLPAVKYSSRSTPAEYRHLISLRASVLNDCRACVTTHRRDARLEGWSRERILHAEDWTNHAEGYDGAETAVLRLTDAVTHIDGYESVPDELWDACVRHFGPEGTHDLLVSILAINTFNRLSIATRTDPASVRGTTDFDLDYAAR